METANKPLSAHYWKTKGRFYIGRSDQQWQVVVRASNGKAISVLWDEDDEPGISGLPPSEVVEIISQRVESFLFMSDREKMRATIAWFREHAELIDSGWARDRIESLRKKIDELDRYVLDPDTEVELTAKLTVATPAGSAA